MIKKFSTFVAEATAADYVAPKDDDKEAKEYQPRSKGEKDFKDAHKTEKKAHPTADASVHNGSTTQTSPEGTGKGEKSAVAAGTSVNEPKGGGDSSRPADKKDGEKKPQAVREEVELTEGVLDQLRKIVKSKSVKSVKFANGKSVKVDMTSANALVQLYNKVNDANKKKMEASIEKSPEMMMKLLDVAFGGK